MATLAEIVGTGVNDDGALHTNQHLFSLTGKNPARHTPTTLWGPISLISLSVVEPLALPWPSVSTLPRSPTWRASSVGAPWFWPWGLTIFRISSLQIPEVCSYL